ncbi:MULTISPECIES: hypothetical protein [unclassified Bradyrhizobium]|uniref:hypothetical protein n=1 Tax=unclassified Bradyrhizobium TaxID=2631580 RepID=UPI0028EDE3A3|nr:MULTISPECIES: hypothetical protein [unclassified Bradyrhizobium]
MTENRNRITVGLFMIASHIAVFIALVAFTFAGGFSFEELTTTAGIIGPLFAGYTSAIIAFIIKHKDDRSYGQNKINPVYALVSCAIPALFVAAVLCLIALRAYNVGIADFDTFKTLIGVTESAFGIYVGQFIYSMFEAKSASA